MELSKISALKLTVISVFVALLCLVAVGLLGHLLKAYWQFDSNKRSETERVERLREEIAVLESNMMQKRADIAQIDRQWLEYMQLTNEISQVMAKRKAMELAYSEQTDELARVRDVLSSIKNELALTNAAISVAKQNLNVLRQEIEVANGQKSALSGAEQELANKRVELSGVVGALKNKQEELDVLNGSLSRVRGLLAAAQSNLVSAVERANSEGKIASLRKETILSLEASIAALEARKVSLSKSVDEVEKTIRLQAPKEKILVERLADLAGQYIAETNRLADVRLRLKEEVVQAQAEADADTLRKQQDADRRLARAKETLAAAEKRAFDLVAEAKATVAEIERTAVLDRQASQAAIKEKTEAETALLAASQEKATVDAAKGEAEKAKASLDRRVAALTERKMQLEGEISVLEQKKATAATQVEEFGTRLLKLASEIKALRETEEALARAIASKQAQIKSLTEAPAAEEQK